jgi:protein-L-isoaspartate O-methyltransferase
VLRDQLAPGGRLVMPVGRHHDYQHLIKLTRRSPTEFEREVLDAVSFVPLVGAQGWAEDPAH